jgi:ABC-type transporter Mla subunit MlaD
MRKFTESLEEISLERKNDIIDELNDLLSLLSEKDKYIDSLINELNNFISTSEKSNDQIDDSISKLGVAKNDLSNFHSKIEEVLENLESYKEENRKPLYGDDETKDF